MKNPDPIHALHLVFRGLKVALGFLLVILVAVGVLWMDRLWSKGGHSGPLPVKEDFASSSNLWSPPDLAALPKDEAGALIRYGRDLIVHTADFLGPKGSVRPMSNGMNCQNCHLDAGTKPFGNNYSAVASTYPKVRARSGQMESIEKRINDCFERSLNGSSLAEDSREMKAMVAYMKWLGTGVPAGDQPNGVGLVKLTYLERPASVENGRLLFAQKCVVCHGENGQGIGNKEGSAWIYPPLWGEKSYNTGAGLYRLSRFAGYIKANMPLGATFDNPQLTDEETWDIAAFVNSLPRPEKKFEADWPDISKKPIDHPFGPYADSFDEVQHKYGPFKPIEESRAALGKGKEVSK